MKQFTNQKIYAQLRPDDDSVTRLIDIQHGLPKQSNGRMIGRDELHMTLIHFGRVDDALTKIRANSTVEQNVFEDALNNYIHSTEAILGSMRLKLEYDHMELLGPRKTALAVLFKPTEALSQLHTKLFACLVEFFENVGVANPLDFIMNDMNFKFSSSLLPHVTLYKVYDGDARQNNSLITTIFEPMPVRY